MFTRINAGLVHEGFIQGKCIIVTFFAHRVRFLDAEDYN